MGGVKSFAFFADRNKESGDKTTQPGRNIYESGLIWIHHTVSHGSFSWSFCFLKLNHNFCFWNILKIDFLYLALLALEELPLRGEKSASPGVVQPPPASICPLHSDLSFWYCLLSLEEMKLLLSSACWMFEGFLLFVKHSFKMFLCFSAFLPAKSPCSWHEAF